IRRECLGFVNPRRASIPNRSRGIDKSAGNAWDLSIPGEHQSIPGEHLRSPLPENAKNDKRV
ncbi:MAG: hypothetical protein DRI57_00095, partial [Deltaproteobacteria bacterium]